MANNHHKAPKPGEDLQTFEQDLPGQNTAGYSKGTVIGQLPLETVMTMNKVWGYDITDKKYKSSEYIIQHIIKAAGNNANYVINIGPRPDGKLPVEAVERLKAIGDWMGRYGETIYGTLQNGALSAGAINTDLVSAEIQEKYQSYLDQMVDGTFMK